MGFLIGRYMARHKGDYRTHEADNADIAPDADWAVQHATTGPQVKKNTEMYIWGEQGMKGGYTSMITIENSNISEPQRKPESR